MSFLAKVSTFFGLEDEEYMEEEQVRQPRPTKQPRPSRPVAQKTAPQQTPSPSPTVQQNAFDARRKKTPMKQTSETVRKPSEQSRMQPAREQVKPQEKKVVSMRQSQQPVQEASAASKITIIQPRVYSEAMTIAKHVMSGESVLVNFHLIEEYQARRIVDFLTGTVYAEDGDIKRVADEIFLCTPKGTEIDGTAQSLVDNNFFDV